MKPRKSILSMIPLICLFFAACDDSEPVIHPIRFERQDYTIFFGVNTIIPFIDGGGIYELTASNPEVLGECVIDIENNRLIIHPLNSGESALTITDVRANTQVTLNITVEDFYLSCKVERIEGTNLNPYLLTGDRIRFIRSKDDEKFLKILRTDDMSQKDAVVAEGIFDIEHSETNIFTMSMSLHAQTDEVPMTFEYTIERDSRVISIFSHHFSFQWEESLVSTKSQPPQRVVMQLTDTSNGCQITCAMQPLER